MNPMAPVIRELEHLCESSHKQVELLERMMISLDRINGRLDRLELFLARQGIGYPDSQTNMPDLPRLRAVGIPE